MVEVIRPKYCLIYNEITNKSEIKENFQIIVDDGLIHGISPVDIPLENYVIDSVTELTHHIVLPGLINTHNHTAMTLFRGFADDYMLQEWLEDHIWPMESRLNQEFVYNGAKFAAIEMVMSGTTTVNSMYWYPEGEIQGFVEVGARLMVGPPIISGVKPIDEYHKLIHDYHAKYDDLIRIALNPHAPYTVTAEEYQEIHEYKQKYNANSNNTIPIKLHTHLAESPIERDLIQNFAKEQGFQLPDTDLSPVEYLDRIEILDSDTIAAHSVECSKEDIKILQERNVGVSANVASNMKLGNNIPKLDLLCNDYSKVGFGTDGPSSNNNLDMFETMKLSALAIKSEKNDPTLLPALQVLEIATHGGAKVLGWDNIGSLKVGNYADLIAVDLNKPHLRPISSHKAIISHLVYSANGNDVSHTMIGGKWKMIEKKLINFDLLKVLEDFEDVAKTLFE